MGNREERETQRHRGHREEGKGGEEREETRRAPNALSLRVSLLDLANFAPLR
jgi:hypothetical protein